VQPDPAFSELRTARLLLRRSRPHDAEAISAYRSDPDVHVHQGWSKTDPDHVRGEIEEMLQRAPGEPGGWVQFSIETRDAGELIGDVGLRPADDEPGVILAGYTVAPAQQGRGYATEAVGAMVDYALHTLGADVVRAYADAGNAASVRVAEKVGLLVVDRFEGSDGDGTWHGVRMERRRANHPT
jgi:RimJ/RimL family protein N-acetyltransferase